MNQFGDNLRSAVANEQIVPLMGVYDVFSASIAARYFDGIFVSGFSFAASHYGLPDIGFIAWPDIVAFTQRIRAVLPRHHIVVDIDDGYCDTEVACHVAKLLEGAGASGVILEDQQRPRRCGHLDGKQIMELEPFLDKLEKILQGRSDLFVVARTDATDEQEALRRAQAYAEAGADAIMVEAVKDLELIRKLRTLVNCPVVFNQIAGGKSPRVALSDLQQAGVSIASYSTPCLFAAQSAINDAMKALREDDGLLPAPEQKGVGIKECNDLLHENLAGNPEV